MALMLRNPFYAVVVKACQVARLVVAYQQLQDTLLVCVFSHTLSLAQPIDDVADGVGIAAIGTPHVFLHDTIALDECRVQTIGHWRRVIGIVGFLLCIELLRFLLRHSLIEVACGGLDEVCAVGFVDTLGQHRRVEDDRKQFITHLPYRFS